MSAGAATVLVEDLDLVIGELEQEVPLSGATDAAAHPATCRSSYCTPHF